MYYRLRWEQLVEESLRTRYHSASRGRSLAHRLWRSQLQIPNRTFLVYLTGDEKSRYGRYWFLRGCARSMETFLALKLLNLTQVLSIRKYPKTAFRLPVVSTVERKIGGQCHGDAVFSESLFSAQIFTHMCVTRVRFTYCLPQNEHTSWISFKRINRPPILIYFLSYTRHSVDFKNWHWRRLSSEVP
jgi:hypothetical protein